MGVLPAIREDGLPEANAGTMAIGRHLLEETTQTTTAGVTYVYFFDDPYNKAMYLVLPIMVFIYGGCGAIYCIAKLRRYAKRKHRERVLEKVRSQSTSTPTIPFIIEADDDDEYEDFIRPRKEKTGIVNPLVDMVGKKQPMSMTMPLGEPPPYSPEPAYLPADFPDNLYDAPTIHVFQQPDSPEVHRSAPPSRAGIADAVELKEKPGLDPFHMPRPKKKKRLVFIAI